MRRTRCLRASITALAAFLVVARAATTTTSAASTTTTVVVDDSDPGIEYRGSWVHNAIDDPKDFNYGGSTTFTNATGSTATYRFQGIAIAVYGAFEVAGTFAMHSSYTIDGGAPADFLPAGTVLRPAYHQKFFQSGTLSNGAHTIVITNLEREFWLDYLIVTQPAAASTSTAAAAPKSTAPQEVQTPATTSTAPAAPATTGMGATASFTGQLSSFTPSSQTAQSTSTSTHSFSDTNNVTLTSTDGVVAPSLTASESQTSTPASGAASPTSTATHGPSTKIPTGAIAGVAVGGLLVLTLIGVVGYRCRRRKQAKGRRPDLTPYDPGLTALAIEASEKQRNLGHDSDAASRGSTAISVLSLPLPAAANARYPAETRSSGTSVERSILHEIRTTDLDVGVTAAAGMSGGSGDRRTGFEPLGSPSSASPLLPRTRTRKDSPVTPAHYGSPMLDTNDDMEGGRRSLDGGVRLAGGPPDAESARRGDDAHSGVSTLPPAYRVYPAA